MKWIVLLPILAFAGDYEDLTMEIRCMACNGQVIAESHHPVAISMKEEVGILLKDGCTTDEVRAQMVMRYGEQVLTTPSSEQSVLWLLPFGFLLTALLFWWRNA